MAVKLSFRELYFPSSPRSLKVWSVAEGDKGPREGGEARGWSFIGRGKAGRSKVLRLLTLIQHFLSSLAMYRIRKKNNY